MIVQSMGFLLSSRPIFLKYIYIFLKYKCISVPRLCFGIRVFVGH